MGQILDLLLKTVVVLGMISLLVAAHEWGHYIVARAFKMGVEEFSVGMFGRRPLLTLGRKRYRVPLPADSDAVEGDVIDVSVAGHGIEGGAKEDGTGPRRMGTVVRGKDGRLEVEEETIFNLRPWPIGGFVRIKGMAPREDGSETQIPGGFYSRPPWQRFLALAAGPAASLVAGVALLTGLYASVPVPIPDPTPRVDMLLKEGAGYKAGLRPKDLILSVGGQPVTKSIEVIRAIRDGGGKPVEVEVDRKGERLAFTMTPALDAKATPVLGEDFTPNGDFRRQAKIGVQFGSKEVRLSPAEALERGVRAPIETAIGVIGIIRNPIAAKDQVGGAVSIVDVTAKAVDRGVAQVIEIAGMLSITVGIFNLLPIFPLDGGQMVMALAEMVRRKRPSIAFQNAIAVAGFVFLIVLIVSVNLHDVWRRLGAG